MKFKENLKKVIAFATSLTVTSMMLPSLVTHAESPSVEVERFPYTLFASSSDESALMINANNVCVNGNVATNGTIESTSSNFNVNGSVYENCNYNVPNLVTSLMVPVKPRTVILDSSLFSNFKKKSVGHIQAMSIYHFHLLFSFGSFQHPSDLFGLYLQDH